MGFFDKMTCEIVTPPPRQTTEEEADAQRKPTRREPARAAARAAALQQEQDKGEKRGSRGVACIVEETQEVVPGVPCLCFWITQRWSPTGLSCQDRGHAHERGTGQSQMPPN